MSGYGALGLRMKAYEESTRAVLPIRSWAVLRVDGRAFHTWTRHAKCVKPFDHDLATGMNKAAAALLKDIAGSTIAYVQSDEISVVFSDTAALDTQPWFGGEVQKIVSVAASVATSAFNDFYRDWPERLNLATFDARVFPVAQPIEVGNYLLWRQQDAVRNSISMLAQANFSHKQLQGVKTNQMQEMLWRDKGINWNDTDDGFKRGRLVTKATVMRPPPVHVQGTPDLVARTEIRVEAAPHYNAAEWASVAADLDHLSVGRDGETG